MAAGPVTVGLVHGDVDPGVADDLHRPGETPAVPELGPDRHRGETADPEVVGDQGPTGGLACPEPDQLGAQRPELRILARWLASIMV